MSLNVSVPAKMEVVLRQRASGLGKDVNTFVRAITSEDVTSVTPNRPRREAHDVFLTKLNAMIQRQGIRNGNFNDSRKSTYAGRGE